MKNLIIALTLFVFLLVFGSFVITRSIEAQTAENVLPILLELPAPPPPNPLVPVSNRVRPEDFYSKNKPPGDNAPIDELLDYWKTQSERFRELGYNLKLSGRSLDRVLAEIEKDPEKVTEFLNVLPETEETAGVIKRIYDQISPEENEEESENYYNKNQIKNWLKYHSSYFSDELLATAQSVGDTSVGYVSNQNELLALARVDWNKAKPILDRLYNDSSQPISQTLARWAFYRHALDTDSLGDIERYRDELKADVENKKASNGLRDLAFDALVKEDDWSGRDDWYFTLLEDETLADLRVGGSTYTGLTTILLYAPPEKYADKMIELVKSNNPAVRNAAVRNLGTLLDENNPEVVKALLPWLEDENWAKEVSNERRTLITALSNFEIPESVPGLIALLDEKETREVPEYSSYSNSNSVYIPPPPKPSANFLSNTTVAIRNTDVTVKTRTVESYPFRSAAISALAKQKDIRAVPALRRILPQAEQYERTNIIRAIFLSNGFSIPEQLAALEAAAQSVKEAMETEVALRKAKLEEKEIVDDVEDVELDEPPRIATIGTFIVANTMTYSSEQKPPPPMTAAEIKAILGQQIIANPEPSPELLAAIVQRINVLDRQNPPLANALRRIMLNWKGTAVNLVLLNDLKTGKADINTVVKLLSIRKELREKQINDIYTLRSGGTSVALGISACLLETQGDLNALLVTENTEAKAAMFGCARLIRAELPVQIVAQNLNSPNKLLALSAERYLESEDSPQARQIILSKYPNEAKILGATTYFGDRADIIDGGVLQTLFQSVEFIPQFEQYYYFYGDDETIVETEKKLQKEIKSAAELLGVYAYDDNFVRIYQDRVMFSFAEDESRYRERYLTPAEFDNLKNYLLANRVDDLKPFLKPCEEECEEKELLMLGRQGGRRVYFKGFEKDGFFNGLDGLFEEMRKPSAKLRYELEKSITGLEILFADKNLQAGTVWKNGNDLRILINDTNLREQIEADLAKQDTQVKYDENTDYAQIARQSRERRAVRANDHLSWRKFTGESLGEPTAPPSNFGFPPPRDAFSVRPSTEQWKARTANLEIRADESGLYKISGGTIKKIRDGFYDKPIVTPDGRWAVASKLDPEEGFALVRINLANNQEFKIETEVYMRFEPAAALPSGKKVLFRFIPYSEYYNDDDDEPEADGLTPPDGEILVLDVETGAVEKAKGEIRPLAGQTFRPLQTASKTDEFWAAIPDAKATRIGTYNMKTLIFKPLMTIPQISFGSMNMWVDETEGKVYFVYKGQLLALKLK
ncbi:hypothetical protein BH20ACI4_BH20ACI4_17870 [soil metagenome]